MRTLISNARGSVQNWLSNLFGHRLFRDRLSLNVLIPTLILNVLSIAIMLVRVRPMDFSVPVRYSSLVGFDVLGPWYQLYSVSLFGLGVTVMNTALAMQAFQRSRIASFFLLVGAFVVSLFCLIIGTALVTIL